MAPPCFILQQRNGNGLRLRCRRASFSPRTGCGRRNSAREIDTSRQGVPRTFAGIARTCRALTSRVMNREGRRLRIIERNCGNCALGKTQTRSEQTIKTAALQDADRRLCFLCRSPNATVIAHLPNLTNYRRLPVASLPLVPTPRENSASGCFDTRIDPPSGNYKHLPRY